ncbi:hypothetical protein HMPREF0591_0306 [Mycobacterium parascrofulaceum ATCC BAA-614]|uniref:Uncharacterized protein n=1 Tax=Mycobacterium parascrofulaceum ATCC BAA-614 TaxID=525368 RepID=D5P2B2_9MYCO|nr:hypothetical protein HMPREF0591_0306 [Mycobacterium parascrofulaceum ATCC BAA-614]
MLVALAPLTPPSVNRIQHRWHRHTAQRTPQTGYRAGGQRR